MFFTWPIRCCSSFAHVQRHIRIIYPICEVKKTPGGGLGYQQRCGPFVGVTSGPQQAAYDGNNRQRFTRLPQRFRRQHTWAQRIELGSWPHQEVGWVVGHRSSGVGGGNQASTIVPVVNLKWVLSGARRRLCATDVSVVVSLMTELGNSGRSGGLRAGQPHYLATDGQGGGATPTLVEEVGFIPRHDMLGSVRSAYVDGLGMRGSEYSTARLFLLSFGVAFSYDEASAVAINGNRVSAVLGH